jgi:hypothetical protein
MYNLSKGPPALAYVRPPCPIFPGSEVRFNYRFDGHATHQPVLHAAVLETTGDIIEFGMGHYSTPLLHELCGAMGRRLVSLDTDAAWVQSFSHLAAPWHRLAVVSSWNESESAGPGGDMLREVYGQRWGVVLVDQHPETARLEVARRLKGQAELVVMHDANRQLGQAGFPRYAAQFRSHREYMPARPYPVLGGPPTLVGSEERGADLGVDADWHDQWCYASQPCPLPADAARAAGTGETDEPGAGDVGEGRDLDVRGDGGAGLRRWWRGVRALGGRGAGRRGEEVEAEARGGDVDSPGVHLRPCASACL